MSSLSTPQSKFEQALQSEFAGQYVEAERLYQEVLADVPNHAPSADRLGLVALARRDPETALRWFETALGLDPAFPPAWVNAGIALQQLARLDDAEAMFANAIAQGQNAAPAHYLLGKLLWDRGAYKEACEHLSRAIILAPEFANEFQDELFNRLNRFDWRGYKAITGMMSDLIAAGRPVSSPLTFMYYSASVADIGSCARTFATRNHPQRTPLWNGEARKPGKIRIGYLCADYYDHPVAHLHVGVLENHNHDEFEVFGFSSCPPMDDKILQRIIPAFDHFFEVANLTDLAIAELVRAQDIDILVNLSGYTLNARADVMTGRPAPVQVNYLGYPGTMGATYVDYLIADRQVISPDETQHYSENIVLLPHTSQPTDDKAQVAARTPTRSEQGLHENAFVFLAYNAPRKISPDTFSAWMRILESVPGSVIWLMDTGPEAQANARREAADRGVDPARLVFAAHAPSREDHLARFRLADLFLDSLPYNAHSTASEAMWVGVPVLTCRGTTFPGRVGASLLEAAGFPELITHTVADFEALAVELAKDPVRMANLRKRMETEGHASPLFQSSTYTRHLEAAYRIMFDNAQKKSPPRHFGVQPIV